MSVKTEWEIEVDTPTWNQSVSVFINATVEGLKVDKEIIPWTEIDAARESLAPTAQESDLNKGIDVIGKALKAGEDATGLGTVRDAVAYMVENKADISHMCFHHIGRKFDVEIRIKKPTQTTKTSV